MAYPIKVRIITKEEEQEKYKMIVYLFLVAILGFSLYLAYNYIRTLGFNHNSALALMILAPLILLIFLFRRRKQNKQGFWLFVFGLSLIIILFFQFYPSISRNIDSSIENSKVDKVIQDFNGTDWESQGDNSPIVQNFCSAVCSPSRLNSYGIGGFVKSISCQCGNGNYNFDYKNNILREMAEGEYAQKLADYHKNNP